MRQRGFTLFELLFVCLILTVFISGAVAIYRRDKSHPRRHYGELRTGRDVVEQYGPPDRAEHAARTAFMYYKQTTGYRVYTINEHTDQLLRVDDK